MDVLQHASSAIEKYGGHKEAAGLTVRKDKLKDFINLVRSYEVDDSLMNVPDIAYMAVKISDVTLENIEFIRELAPFGCGNPKPLFLAEDVLVTHMRKIGKKEGAEDVHLKAAFRDVDGRQAVDAIGFFMSEYCKFIEPGSSHISIVFSMEGNVWAGELRPQIILKDIVIPELCCMDDEMEVNDLYEYDEVPIDQIIEEYGEDIIPHESEYYPVFCMLNKIMKDKKTVLIDIPMMSKELSDKLKMSISSFKLMRILDAIIEAGYYYGTRVSSSVVAIRMRLGEKSYMQIMKTKSYKEIHNF